MNEREAQEIVRMVESGWSSDFGIQGRTLWCQMLYPFDAELATNAVVEMSKHPLPGGRFKPHVSDLREIIVSLKTRKQEPREIDEFRRGVATPEWVWIWSWARMRSASREERNFPQQDGHVDSTNVMSDDDYERLRSEWIAAGRPKSKSPLPTGVGK